MRFGPLRLCFFLASSGGLSCFVPLVLASSHFVSARCFTLPMPIRVVAPPLSRPKPDPLFFSLVRGLLHPFYYLGRACEKAVSLCRQPGEANAGGVNFVAHVQSDQKRRQRLHNTRVL